MKDKRNASAEPGSPSGEPPTKRPKPVPCIEGAESGAANCKAAAVQPQGDDQQRALHLLEALAHFQEGRQQRQLFMEVDVAAEVESQALVGRTLRVLWPNDEAWYLGRVVSYDPATGRHAVDYADGDHGCELLALERVRLLVHAGEELPAPSPDALAQQAVLLLQLADAAGKGKNAGPLRAKAQQLMNLADKRRAALREQAQQDVQHGQQAQQGAQPSSAKEEAQQRVEGQEAGQPQQQQHETAAQAEQQQGLEQQQQQALLPLLPPLTRQQKEQEQQWRWQPLEDGKLLPGEVVWGRVSGYRDWPAIAITQEEAIARGATSGQARAPHNTPVLFFGTAEVGCLRQAVITCFGKGVGCGFHCPKTARKEQAFRRSLCEVETYLRTGELPPCMLPDHNDGHGSSSDGEEEEGAPAPKRGKSKVSKRQSKDSVAGAAGVLLPLQANKHVTVLALGRVEFIHPAFHDERHIWPVGYLAHRLAATPASKGKEVPHTCEVLEAGDGSGPLFRVTPKGGQAVEGPSATLAWQALYAADSHGKVRSMGISGPTMFGLAAPRVQAAIHKLPGAQQCERYCGWPEGEQPEEVQPLDAAEQRARLACTARMQKLPPEVRPVPREAPWASAASAAAAAPPTDSSQTQRGQQGAQRAWRQQQGAGTCRQAACEVCMSEEEMGDDLIIQCDGCLALVHMSCYGVENHPHGDLWLCDVCSLGLERPPACVLCPVVGGVMKPTACGRWCHSACGLWTEETRLDAERGVIHGVQEVKGARLKLSCQVCKQQYGSCVQCAGSKKCYASFHPLCAWGAGYAMELVHDPDTDSDSEDDSGDENDSGATNRQSSKRARRARHRDGTGLGSGMWLTAYCPKHLPELGRGYPPLLQRQPSRALSIAASGSLERVEAGSAGPGARGGAGVAATSGALAGQQSPAPLLTALRPLGGNSAGGQMGREASNAALIVPGTAAAWYRGALQEGMLLWHAASMPGAPSGSDCSWPEGTAVAAAGRSSSGGGAGVGGRNAPLGVNPLVEAAAARGQPGHTPAGATAAAAVAVGGPSQEGFSGCARAVPFNHAARRGQRAPEAIAAAEAKRSFVLSLPYIVGGPLQQDPQRVPPSMCHAPPPGQQQPTPAQPQPKQQQQNPGPQEHRPASPAAEAGGPATSQQQQQQEEEVQAGPAAPPDHQRPCLPAAPALRPNGERILSQGERFAKMRRSVGQRLTIGKSGIHGWGAFAKQRHSAGDMVIEYAGEVVRHSVSDVRERQCYNVLVGAGTYTFSLNEHLNVDATRAGNMAHILNHSCGPNCFSRTLSLKGSGGRVEDHVVIFALRDIEVGEELTYDYRFSGKEQLPCNCGAPCCRGLVNKPANREGLWVPMHKLKPLRPPKGAGQATSAH